MPTARKPFLVGGATGIVLLTLLGVMHIAGPVPAAFDLDGEWTVPAAYSALLLLSGAIAALGLSQRRLEPLHARPAAGVLGLFLLFVAGDELLSLHERIDARLGIDWQVLYLPMALVAAAAGATVVVAMRRSGERAWPLIAGALAWVVAQVLEAFQFADLTPGMVDAETLSAAEIHAATHSTLFHVLSVPEEALEMTGSLLIAAGVVAFLSAADRPQVRSAAR